MTTVIEEKEIWDGKAGGDVKYEMWNEYDSVKWDEDAQSCVKLIMDELEGCKELLEIGCGIGRLSYIIATEYSVNVIGMDISLRMLNKAKRHGRVKYVVNNGRDIGLVDCSVDGIYSMITFQHIETSGFIGYINEMGRVLRSGGKFIFQYVDGENKGPLSYHHKLVDVVGWCDDAGLKVDHVLNGAMHDEWNWVVGGKE